MKPKTLQFCLIAIIERYMALKPKKSNLNERLEGCGQIIEVLAYLSEGVGVVFALNF